MKYMGQLDPTQARKILLRKENLSQKRGLKDLSATR